MRLHFLGIGGVGMSALAQAYLDLGCVVSGADRAFDRGGTSAALEALQRQGVALVREDDLPDGIDRLVVTTAIEQDHPALAAAKARGIPVVHRAKALAQAVEGKKLIAVTGTCGKSTVTAMLGHILAEVGLDPMVVDGAAVAGWDNDGARVGSCRKGAGEFAVIEADESDKSLVEYSPWGVVVTNASADHYGVDEMNRVFDQFIASATGGPIVDARGGELEVPPMPEGFRLPMPGRHNAENAKIALAMARLVAPEIPFERLAAALGTMRGVSRRLEYVGAGVFDDYAHNTEKLRAAATTAQEVFPRGVAIVWRPHGYAPLRKMLDDLAAMFAEVLRPQDFLVLPPVYDAGGTADRSVNSENLAAAISAIAPSARVALAYSLANAEKIVAGRYRPGMGVVVCGARDPDLPALARSIAKNLVAKGVPQ